MNDLSILLHFSSVCGVMVMLADSPRTAVMQIPLHPWFFVVGFVVTIAMVREWGPSLISEKYPRRRIRQQQS
jgi:hypothetical protein